MSAVTGRAAARLNAWASDQRARQGGWSIFEYLAYPMLMFVATPVLLKALGEQQYGQWMLLLTFAGFGGVAGLGMGTATIKEVSAFRGRGDLAAATGAIRNTLAITLASSLTLAVVMIGLGVTVAPMLLAKSGSPHVIAAIAVAAAATIVLEQVDGVFVGAIRGCERFDLSAPAEAISKAASVLATVVVALTTRSLVWVIVTSLILMVARTLAKAIIAARLTGDGALLPDWHPPSIRRIFAFGKWTWLLAIAATLFATTDRLLIGGMLGAGALARYSVCLQLAQQVHAIPAAAAAIFFPMVSRMAAEGQDLRQLATRGMAVLCSLSLVIGLPLILFGGAILRLWVGPRLAAGGSPILITLVVSFGLLAINAVPHYVLLGLGRSRIVALANIAAGIAAVVTAYFCLAAFGLVGAACGRAAFAIASSIIAVAMFRQLRSRSTAVA